MTSDRAPRRWQNAALKLLCAGALLLGTSACGVQPGDYRVFLVAESSTQRSPGCFYPDTEPGADEASDVDTIVESLTFTVHYAADDQVWLNADGLALGGEQSGNDFEFIGQDVDVEYLGMEEDARLVVTTDVTASLDISGSGAVGTFNSTAVTECAYITATPSNTSLCPSPPPPECNIVTTFIGVELDDVQLKTDAN